MQIYKWNVYNARVPFVTDFSTNKERPVVVIGFVGDNVIILPISSKVQKKKYGDLDIRLSKPSLIKVGNIQSIHIQDFISPYYIDHQNLSIKRINKKDRKKILASLNKIFT